jgi:hypothetical protein
VKPSFSKIKVLITVMTYPHPSESHQELVCTAGITEAGEWVRLHPIDYRYRGQDGFATSFPVGLCIPYNMPVTPALSGLPDFEQGTGEPRGERGGEPCLSCTVHLLLGQLVDGRDSRQCTNGFA